MKIILRIIILALVFYMCYSILAEAQIINRDRSNREVDKVDSPPAVDSNNSIKIQGKKPNLSEYEYDRTVLEDEDFFPYDQDYLTRRLFQKKWDPLTRRETIIWSFRMANANAFL